MLRQGQRNKMGDCVDKYARNRVEKKSIIQRLMQNWCRVSSLQRESREFGARTKDRLNLAFKLFYRVQTCSCPASVRHRRVRVTPFSTFVIRKHVLVVRWGFLARRRAELWISDCKWRATISQSGSQFLVGRRFKKFLLVDKFFILL